MQGGMRELSEAKLGEEAQGLFYHMKSERIMSSSESSHPNCTSTICKFSKPIIPCICPAPIFATSPCLNSVFFPSTTRVPNPFMP